MFYICFRTLRFLILRGLKNSITETPPWASTKMEYRVATDKQLALMLKSLRKTRKLTQAQLGERLGMSQRMVAKLEAHPETASFARVFQALNALGIDVILKDRSPANTDEAPAEKSSKAGAW